MSDSIASQGNGAERKLRILRIISFVGFILFLSLLPVAKRNHQLTGHDWLVIFMIILLLYVPNAVRIYYEGRFADDPSLSKWSRRTVNDRIVAVVFYQLVWLFLWVYKDLHPWLLLVIAGFGPVWLAPYFLGRLVAQRRTERV